MSKRVALWSLSLVLVAFSGSCNSSPSEPDGTVELTLTLSQASVRPSGRLDMTLVVTNASSQEVRFDFPLSCWFNFRISQGTEQVWDLLSTTACLTAITSIVLQPGETRNCSTSWNLRDLGGNPVPPGRYEAQAQLPTHPLMSPAVSFRVED